MQSLVVYYSRTGNAKFVAEKIAAELKADTEEVIDLKNRRGWFGFIRGGYDATRNKETKIEKTQKLPKDYDLIVVGTPVWNSRVTPAIRTYLKGQDFSGKKVSIFSTNEGRGTDKTFSMMKSLIQHGTVVGEIGISKALDDREKTESKILYWCSNLKSV